MRLIDNVSPSFILDSIMDYPIDWRSQYTYIILGDGPRTGKSWLCHWLREYGLNAYEISEDVVGLVTYRDKKNHCKVDELRRQVTIILNSPLSKN